MKKETTPKRIITFRTLVMVFLALISVHVYAQRGQLYSGLLERGYPKAHYANTPYYPQQFQKGKVTYGNYTYENVSLKTDLATGQLIILSPATGLSLAYAPQDLDRIEMNGLQLVYLEKPSSGWYEIIGMGKDWTLYRHHYVSNITREVKGASMGTRFVLSQKVYLLRQQKWTAVNGLSALCKQFKEQKSRIQSFAQEQGLNLNAQDLEGWKLMVEYLNTL